MSGIDLDLTERLRRLALYGAGWDGYRGAPAGAGAVESACAFVAALGAGDGLEASLEPDGTVDLAGVFAGRRVVLGFVGDGTVEVSVREDGSWRDLGTRTLSAPGGRMAIPEDLRGMLTAPSAAAA